MDTQQQLKEKLKGLLDKRQEKRMAFQALLGDGSGNVAVPGRANYVYVRGLNGETLQVYNDSAPLVDDLPVWVGYDNFTTTLLQILSLDRSAVATGEAGEATFVHVAMHGNTHSWGGVDVTPIYLRQVMDLQPVITGDWEVTIQRGLAPTARGGWNLIVDEVLDLADYAPTSGALYCLVYSDQNGELQIRPGALKDSTTFLEIGDIPAALPGEWPVCAVRLYADQTVLVEDETTVDLVDLRFVYLYQSAMLARNIALVEAELDLETTRLAMQAWADRRNAAVSAAEFDFEISKHVVGG